ncbi:hypothetical protein MRX96_005300 [Rhipicephalus microplus]
MTCTTTSRRGRTTSAPTVNARMGQSSVSGRCARHYSVLLSTRKPAPTAAARSAEGPKRRKPCAYTTARSDTTVKHGSSKSAPPVPVITGWCAAVWRNAYPHQSAPPKKKLATPPGKCCPTCVEEDGVCTVYGDPHYRTFDGRMFNYQGPCRYVLASDCVGGTFSIEVWNDVRYSKSFSWTKSVVIKIKDVRVKLGQFMRVRIQKKRVKLPYVMLQVLNINQEDHNIVVRINKGVKVVWDGDNYVEVSVSPTYKNKLCGLCGNYNDKQEDDFVSRNGTRLADPNAFGNSWLVGRRKRCFRPATRASHPLDCRLKHWNLRQQNLKLCNHIKQEPFKACHKVVEATSYFRSCMLDMCECLPSDKCYCDSLNAYARECNRAGIKIDWKHITNCEGMHCPRGSDYTPCGPPMSADMQEPPSRAALPTEVECPVAS